MTREIRYAPHLGYRPPFSPLFTAMAGSEDPVDHVHFASDQGFAGVLYAAACSRPPSELHRVGDALARLGLEAGCVLYTSFDQVRNTSWATDSKEARRWISAELEHAMDVARSIGAKRLAILGGARADETMSLQREALIHNLRYAADIAARAGVMLCLETLSRKSIPGMLLGHIADALAVAKAVDHPAVRLIFDTSHVQIMDGDLLFNLAQAWDYIEVVQLADNPGRLEPGTGEINFENILRYLKSRGYAGLVELEYGWRIPGLESEKLGLKKLGDLDVASSSFDGPETLA